MKVVSNPPEVSRGMLANYMEKIMYRNAVHNFITYTGQAKSNVFPTSTYCIDVGLCVDA